MARKLKRTELVHRIAEKAGLPRDAATLGYLSRRQMQALLLWIEKNEHDWEQLRKEMDILKERARTIYGGTKSKTFESKGI